MIILPTYSIARKTTPPPPSANWHSPWWSDVPALSVSNFYFQSTRHHPPTWAKVAHTNNAIHVLFLVHDRFLRCKNSEIHSKVWHDSCVEFFMQPRPDRPIDRGGGYFNVEINCAEIPLVSYVENPKKVRNIVTKFTPLRVAEIRQIQIIPSITTPIPFSHPEPLTWSLQYSIPLSILENYVGRLRPLAGQWWRGNFFKCADRSKYPHWGSWALIGRQPNFHQPDRFGSLYFRRIAATR